MIYKFKKMICCRLSPKNVFLSRLGWGQSRHVMKNRIIDNSCWNLEFKYICKCFIEPCKEVLCINANIRDFPLVSPDTKTENRCIFAHLKTEIYFSLDIYVYTTSWENDSTHTFFELFTLLYILLLLDNVHDNVRKQKNVQKSVRQFTTLFPSIFSVQMPIGVTITNYIVKARACVKVS